MENDIMSLIKQCLHQLCLHQPDNPAQFLKQYLTSEQVTFFFEQEHFALPKGLENDT